MAIDTKTESDFSPHSAEEVGALLSLTKTVALPLVSKFGSL